MSPSLQKRKSSSVSTGGRPKSTSSPISSHGTTADKFRGRKRARVTQGKMERFEVTAAAAAGAAGSQGGNGYRVGSPSSSSTSSKKAAIAAAAAPTASEGGDLRGENGLNDRLKRASSSARAVSGGWSQKKLHIRPFSRPPQVPDQYLNQIWDTQLVVAVRAVQNQTSVSFSFEELYQKVENLCLQKKTEELYKKLEQECDRHLGDKIASLLDKSTDSEAFLAFVDRVWRDHCSQFLTIRSIFLFLDRKHASQDVHHANLWDMALQLFKKHLVANEQVMMKTIDGILKLIEKDRDGENMNKSLLRTLFEMFMSTKLFAGSLSKPFLEATRQYYQLESVKSLQEHDIATYLRHVENRLEQEMERKVQYFDNTTQKALIHVVEENLLANHISVILDKGFNELCDEVRLDDLTRLHRLVGRVNLHEGNDAYSKFIDAFVGYIHRQGSSIVLNVDQDEYMVQSLLDFKQKLDKILSVAFGDNEAVSKAEKNAFEVLINMRQNNSAELIARFIDQVLKTGNKKYSEDELEDTLERVMSLFRFIYGKDIFEAFYKKELAKRLLFDRSASIDLENGMISKLKVECGSAFTNKLEGMFKDVNLSTDIMHSFRDHRRSADKLGEIDLKVNVLTTSYWPSMANQEIKLPAELLDDQETFKNFYLEKYKRRVLTWQYGLGMCTLTANFPKRQHYLSVSLYQTVILLMFNDGDMLTYNEIEEGTGLSGPDLDRALLSLSCGKHRVITKSPKGREVTRNDRFIYAKDFCKSLVLLKINSIQMQATPEENQQTTVRVFQERKQHIDAAIVRIMKMRKVMHHKQLIVELYEQIKFPYRPNALKSRIEALIDMEYLEREEGSPDKYRYLA